MSCNNGLLYGDDKIRELALKVKGKQLSVDLLIVVLQEMILSGQKYEIFTQQFWQRKVTRMLIILYQQYL